MKIAITGHSAGIGQAFSKILADRGHEIVGISKRDGHNIRNIPKIVDLILPCDMWINNAQAGYAQTELLYHVSDAWKGQTQKLIWIISTMMIRGTSVPEIPGLSWTETASYKNQKRALEDAYQQIKSEKGSPRLCMIRPGSVATQPGQLANEHGADVMSWAQAVVDFYTQSRKNNLWLEEISLGFKKEAPDL